MEPDNIDLNPQVLSKIGSNERKNLKFLGLSLELGCQHKSERKPFCYTQGNICQGKEAYSELFEKGHVIKLTRNLNYNEN